MTTSALQTRLAFIQMDESVRQRLRELRPLIKRVLPGVLDAFYAHVEKFPDTARLFRDKTHMRHARDAQLKHWELIASADFDEAYVASVTRVGKAHQRLGLEPRWYIGGYSMVVSGLLEAIEIEIDTGGLGKAARAEKRAHKAKLLSAVTTASLLDMDFAISVYLDMGVQAKQEVIDRLSHSFRTIIDTVSSASTELEATASALSTTARTTTDLTTVVAGASEEASSNVQAVAAATEELSSSVHEIARQVSESNRIAGDAVGQAQKTDDRITALSQAATKIGDVVKLITAIAEQTNLLALNATIEAARAGESGKGFAVVAQEVKALAAQTSKATDDIRVQIASMQEATQESVAAIKEIGTTIGRISEISATIAAAVEEQGAATKEIAGNVTRAAQGTLSVATNITEVNKGAVETGTAADQLLSSAQSLAEESTHLKSALDEFVASVRVA
ncbi:MAG: globin-coupled sensor protein [Xanthobacteraceae bacterium]